MRAIELAQEALALIPITGDLRYLAGMHANLAMAYLALGQLAEAARFARLGLERAQELAMHRNIALQLDVLASVAARRGAMATAAQLFGAADAARASEDLARWHPAEQALYGPAHAAGWDTGTTLAPVDLRALATMLATEAVAPTVATVPHTR